MVWLHRCCTVNFPQGWPKFITSAFLTADNGKGLVQLYLGPFNVETTLAGGKQSISICSSTFTNIILSFITDNSVKLSVGTLYPFDDRLNTTITATKSFIYYIRVPSWVVGGYMSMNDGEQIALTPDEQTGLMAVVIGAGETNISMDFPAQITIGTYIALKTFS